MPGICRDGSDTAGAALIKSQTKVFANGVEVIVHGDTVTAHLAGLHAAPPTMIASHSSSDNVTIGGIAVCNAGDLATCGHKASGSGNVNVNSPSSSVAEDISVAAPQRASVSVSSTDNDVRDVKFNNDGTKVFLLGRANDNVYEYSVGTAWNVSSITLLRQLDISVVDSSQGDNAANSIEFNTDGTKLFMLGQGQDLVNEYALSTGFDLSTASFTRSLNIQPQENLPYGLAFNNDGTKMYITGWTGDDINEYTLTTGFDLSTASFSQLFSVSDQASKPSAVQFNSNGTIMFVLNGTDAPTIFQYTLTTAFDVSTASVTTDKIDLDGTDSSRSNEGDSIILDGTDGSSSNAGSYIVTDNTLFSVLDQETKPRGFCFGDNGTQLYVVGWQGDDINQYAAVDTIVGG